MPKDVEQIIITSQPEAAVIALNEIQKLDQGARGKRLSAEVQLVTIPSGYYTIKAGLPNTIFIRHVFPMNETYDVNEIDLNWKLLEMCKAIPEGEKFSVQLRDSASNVTSAETKELIKFIEQNMTLHGYTCDNKNPMWTLSLYKHEGQIYTGVSRCIDNLSSWNGGIHRLKKSEVFVSRAELKLEEAIASFDIDFTHINGPGCIKHAIDLGAAPGGWTKILLEYGFHVTAVDPAKLSEIIANHPRLTHFRDVAQKFCGKSGAYGLLVNDMRMDIIESSEIMLNMASFLSPTGIAIMTLKLPHKQWYKKVKHALSLLQRQYNVQNARQLFHNRSEITVYLTKLGGSHGCN